ncbi:hypothetical protein [Rubinisphaera sp. JC750]|uniref:hypothetical protein n=1 Tax=Rubinisphaera sp. JC750 TaxID=2898658 RepID=UPI001F17B78F|nr:hypothetical protein [Rubinisphaera sp. JC750]
MNSFAAHDLGYIQTLDSIEYVSRFACHEKVSFVIDDKPEMLKKISSKTAVMLFRNEGNSTSRIAGGC